jgi:hypothetical protein
MVVAAIPLRMDAMILCKGRFSPFSTVIRAVAIRLGKNRVCEELDGIELTTWHAEDASQPLDEGAF